MKVREAQLSKDTPSRDAISGGGAAPTSAPPRPCDTFDMTCGLAVMAARGWGRWGGGDLGLCCKCERNGPISAPAAMQQREEGQQSGAEPPQPNSISRSAAAAGKLPADYSWSTASRV